MCSPSIWKIAKSKSWLEERPINELNKFLQTDNRDQSINSKISSLKLSEEEKLYIVHKIPDKYKEQFSKLIIRDNEFN